MKSIARFLLLIAFLLLAANPAFSQEAACSDLIVNGGFETDEGWRWEVTPKPPSFAREAAMEGSRSVLLGNLDPATDVLAFSSVWQDITIPSDAASVTLSFHYRLISSGPQVFDEARFVLLNPADGSVVVVPWRERQATGDQWREVNLDLTSLTRGKTLRFYFGVVNDGNGNPTAMYLDNVRLLVCSASYVPTLTPTSTPEPAPSPELLPAFTPIPSPEPYGLPLFPSPTPTPSPRLAFLVRCISPWLVILGVVVSLVILLLLFAARRKGRPSGEQQPQKPGGTRP